MRNISKVREESPTRFAILTVVFHETIEHYNMARKCWASFPEGSEVVAVVNRRLIKVAYPKGVTYIENDENCLSKAWNIGLKYLFNKGYRYVFVSGLDSLSPDTWGLEQLKSLAGIHGFASATALNGNLADGSVQHGDGSFSFFCISKKLFEDVGDFDERYKPAYFEDNDYLERMRVCGYPGHRTATVRYVHMFQGTLKHGPETQKNYPEFMQRNLDLFRETYGFTPPHLPADIRFKQ